MAKYSKGDVICFDNGDYKLFYLIIKHSEIYRVYKALGLREKGRVINYIDDIIDDYSHWKKVNLTERQKKVLLI